MRPICRVLPIAPSTYHAHAARRADPGKLPARARSDAALMVEIRRVFEENFHVYGVRKVWRQLGREGIAVARCTVARLMQVMGLQGIVLSRRRRHSRGEVGCFLGPGGADLTGWLWTGLIERISQDQRSWG